MELIPLNENVELLARLATGRLQALNNIYKRDRSIFETEMQTFWFQNDGRVRPASEINAELTAMDNIQPGYSAKFFQKYGLLFAFLRDQENIAGLPVEQRVYDYLAESPYRVRMLSNRAEVLETLS